MKNNWLLLAFFTLLLNYSIAQTYTMSTTTVTDCGGAFYDSGGSGSNYGNNQNFTMTFSSNNGNRLQFNFSSFSTETNYDILYIYDGASINAPFIGQYSGSNSPGIVTSTGTSLTFRFTSDGGTAYSGWGSSISCTTPALTSYPMNNGQTVTACNGVFYDNAGGDVNYSHNQNSVMTFCPSTSNDYLSITFPYQFLLSSDDTLFAYSGSNTNSPLIGIYTNTNKGETISSPVAGTCITFKFVSNSTNASAGWQGILSCSSTPVTPNFNMGYGTRYICGGAFYDIGGSTNNYSNGENKTLTFSSNNGNRLQFNFSSFSTETNYDILYIYDGASINAPFIGQYSGGNSPGIVTSTGTSLTFRFTSDGGTAYSGWSASISCTTPALTSYPMNNGQTVTACSGVFYDNAGGDVNYSHNQNSVMTFCPSTSNDYLSITFPYQFLLSSDDTLFAYSGSNTSSPLIGIYTSNNKGETIFSPVAGTCITFKFVSNSTNASAGWQGILSCSSTPVTPNFNMGYGTRYICGGGFYDVGGNTVNYSNSENKTVTFNSNNGNRIQFNFASFSTESGYDILYIYDGSTVNAPFIGQYSGSTSPGIVTSTGTSLTFRFTSDGGTTYSGWSASISCTTPALTSYPINNGQTVTACNGVFYDNAGGDVNYSHNQNSVMTFCPSTSNDYLSITFPYQFLLSSDDTLFAYSGSTTSSPLIGIYTSNNKGETIASPTAGTCITFKFKSNSTNASAGWQGILSCSSTPVTPNFNMGYGTRYICGGGFYDVGGSTGNYSNSENKIMTFYSNSGCGIKFDFSTFVTETNYDKLYVYDGPSIGSALIGTYSGTQSAFSVQSSGSSLTFKFTSDGGTAYSGWTAAISCPNSPATIVTPSGSLSICQGESVTLSVSNATTYLWSNGATTQSITASTAGTYYATVTNGSGCTGTSLPTEVVVKPLPSTPLITANGSTTFCQGENVILSSSVSVGNIWSNTATTQTISVASGGTYFVTVDSNGCTATSAPVTVTVNSAPPTPIITPNGSVNFCQGGTVTLTSSATSGNTWSNTDVTQSTVINSSGAYTVTVSNGNCTATSLPVTVTVENTAPTTPSAISGNTSVCPGGTNTYSIATVNGATSYTWTLPSGWSGASSTNSISLIAGASGGTISVTANNACGSSTAQTLSVTIGNSAPPTPGSISGTTSVCSGSSNTYSITPVNGANSYTWTLPSGWMGISSVDSINVTVGTIGGTISVTANNSCGSSVAQTLGVTIGGAVPSTPGTISGSATMCANSSETYTIQPVNGATSYNWTLPSGFTGSSTTTSINVSTTTSGGTISVSATNSCGTSPTKTKTIVVQSIDTSVQQLGGILISNAIGANYQWINCANNTAIPSETFDSFMPTVPGNYAVVVTENGCSDTSACYNYMSTSIMESDDYTIHIGPNPSNGKFVIKTNAIFIHSHLEIYNVLGKKVYASVLENTNNHEIEIENASKGIYWLKIYYKNNVVTKKIIIQ